MNKTLIPLLFLIATSATSSEAEPLIITVAPAKPGMDSTSLIREAIAQAKKNPGPSEIRLSPTAYRISPEPNDNFCLNIDDIPRLTLRGEPGASLIVTDPHAGCIRARKSNLLTVESVEIDYDPPPFTQGSITEVDSKSRTITLAIDHGFTPPSNPAIAKAPSNWGMVFEPKEKRLKAGVPDSIPVSHCEAVDEIHYRLTIPNPEIKLTDIQTGDRFVELARQLTTAAIFLEHCDSPTLEENIIHASSASGVVLLASSSARIHRLQIVFLNDSPRLITTDADGVHCQQARIGPIVDECTFEGMCDDAVSIYSVPNFIRSASSDKVVTCDSHVPILAGDLLEFSNPKTGYLGQAHAISVERTDNQLVNLTLDRSIKGFEYGEDEEHRTAVNNANASGHGFSISNNTMHNHRRHGLLIQSGDGTVTGNTFSDIGGLGTVISTNFFKPEGAAPHDIILSNNKYFRDARSFGYAEDDRSAIISIRENLNTSIKSHERLIHNILLENNEIVDCPGRALYVDEVTNIDIKSLHVSESKSLQQRGTHGFGIFSECTGSLENSDLTDYREPQFPAFILQSNVKVSFKNNTFTPNREEARQQ